MALNKYMHPRNIYKNKKPDFKGLALKYPDFKKHVFTDLTGKAFIDFRNAATTRQLSITLVKEDFGIDLLLPPDGLVPTIPLRLNYIHWVEDIMQSSEAIRGVDVGTGASCIYPLLSCKLNPNWTFLALEKNDTNFSYAEKNINENSFCERIQVQKPTDDGILLPLVSDSPSIFDFCMCNPPFFADRLEAQGITTSRSEDRKEPHSVSTASPAESITEGGEVQFVTKMIHESLELKSKIRVYTSMVGKKSSLPKLKEELRSMQIENFATTEFCQGKTMRWGIGWSFDPSVKFPKSLFQSNHKEKPPLQYILPTEFIKDLDLHTIAKQIYFILSHELKIKCESSSQSKQCVSFEMSATENTWSNQRRKRRAKKNKSADLVPTLVTCSPDQDDKKNDKVVSQGEDLRGYKVVDERLGDIPELKRKVTDDCEGENVLKKKRFSSVSDDCVLNTDYSTQNADEKKGKKMVNDDTTDQSKTENQQTMKDVDSSKPQMDGAQSVSDSLELHKSEESTSASEKSFISNIVPFSNTKDHCHSDTDITTEDFIVKFKLNVKEENGFTLEMIWRDGQNREFLHQILQFLKNKTKSNNNEQLVANTTVQ